MRMRSRATAAGLMAVAMIAGTGCVTKKKFQDNVTAVDGRLGSVESGIEANERRITDLKTETDQKIGAVERQANDALQTGQQASGKADAAQAAADRAIKGRLLWSVNLTNDMVKFDHNGSGLNEGTMGVLDDLAAKVKSYGKAVFLEIEGHTDSSGEEAYNLMLGEKRALAVLHYLAQKGGIPLHAMNTISYGESQPVSDNSTREGRAQNRRVVVKVLE